MARRSRVLLVVLVFSALPIATYAGSHRLRLRKPHPGAQISVGPIAVPQGSEITECTYMSFPKHHDMAVDRVDIKVRGGSHHIHLYRPYDHTLRFPEYSHETCNMAVDFDVWQLV